MADPSWVLQDGAVGYHTPTPYTTFQKPKVGLAVVCRCENNLVQCLLQKRGQNSASPNKVSVCLTKPACLAMPTVSPSV